MAVVLQVEGAETHQQIIIWKLRSDCVRSKKGEQLQALDAILQHCHGDSSWTSKCFWLPTRIHETSLTPQVGNYLLDVAMVKEVALVEQIVQLVAKGGDFKGHGA